MAYSLTQRLDLDEIGCTLTQLVHEGCGAKILHLGCDDPENLFCLSFQTLPNRSDGAPHILEHTVLCGSRKYPVKDPFFGMIRRSLNTFMNAMTGDDITFYPAATQVKKDFYNLLDVYVDAAFFPKLERLSFLQEGHRLEFADPTDPKSGLQRKGVVYNEMKGALSSPDARAWYRLVRDLYPDSPYRFNSGGDPQVIPQLTHEELLKFHQTFYHPSRCLFFFYGNFPLEQHLEYLEERILGESEKLPALPAIPRQKRFTQPIQSEDRYPIAAHESSEGKGTVVFGWLTCDATEPLEVLALNVLDLLLMGTDASPLKLALLKSGLCKDAYSFLSGDTADVPFVLVCKGCDPSDADKIEALILQELNTIAKRGFPASQVEAAIHQLEFSRSEIKSNSAPYGLKLFQRCGPLVHLGIEPETGLRIHTLFRDLRVRVAKPATIPSLIQRHLANNPHRSRLNMTADPMLGAQEEASEKAALDKLDIDVQQILDQTKELEAFQAKQDEASDDVLPQVTLDDVSPDPQNFPLQTRPCGSTELFHHACNTNTVVYAALHCDLPHLDNEDLPYVHLLTSMLPEIGCGGRDYRQQLDYLMAHTGGLGVGVSLNSQVLTPDQFRPALAISGKALNREAERLFPLFVDLLSSADFSDRERIQELLVQYYAGMEQGLSSQGLRYATSMATSAFSPAARIAEQSQGLHFFQTIRTIWQDLENQLDPTIERLRDLQERLLGVGDAHLVMSCDAQTLQQHESRGFYGLLDPPIKPGTPWQVPNETAVQPSQGRIIASPVSFTCKALPSLPFAHPDTPALSLAARLFDHLTLHPLIREKGGAYGSGAVNSPGTATFYFYTYRDPHLTASLDAFQTAIDTVSAGQFDARQLEEAKLTFIQKADTPVSPGSRAGVAYGWWREGKALELRKTFRERLLALTPDAIAQAVTTHLAPKIDQGVVVSFAGEELLKREAPFDVLPV